MSNRTTEGMRRYWDDAARENAAWYVDTSLRFDDPDLERFFETGRVIAGHALDDGPVAPARLGLAVEIGPGIGRVCRALAERGFAQVIGIDVSPEMVERARATVDLENVRFEVGDGASLGCVADTTADLVVSFTVFQHIPDLAVIERYIGEAGRVLRSGGVFAFQWNNTPGSRRWQIRRALLSALQRSGLRPEKHRRHAPQFLGSRVPLSRIRRALGAAGLELAGTHNEGELFTWAWARKP